MEGFQTFRGSSSKPVPELIDPAFEGEVDANKEEEIKLEETDELDDWIVVETKSPPSKSKEAEHIKTQPKKDLSWKSSSTPNLITTTSVNLFQFTKEKLYNIIKDIPREPATFAVHLPIYLMGKCYPIFSNQKAVLLPHTSPLLQQFLEDFASQLWFTYRSRFSPLLNSRVTSDMGWGCMIRSTQMLFARALLTCSFGRNSSADDNNSVISFFLDRPGSDHPYSIHNVMEEAARYNIFPGDWFDPTRISLVFKNLAEKAIDCPVAVHVARDPVIFKDEILALSLSKRKNILQSLHDDSDFHPVVVLIPVRLGISNVTNCYYSQIKYFLSCKASLGIVGGRPNSSLYFVGFQGNDLIYLDPHHVHPSRNVDTIHLPSYHCKLPLKISLSEIDPSMAFGFLFTSRNEFEEFCTTTIQFNNDHQFDGAITIEESSDNDSD